MKNILELSNAMLLFFSTCKSARKILQMPSYQHRTKTDILETWGFTAQIKIFFVLSNGIFLFFHDLLSRIFAILPWIS